MQITYHEAPVNQFRVTSTTDKGEVSRMEINGQPVVPTERFWTSLCSNFSTVGLSKKLFGMFSHEEVFDRLSSKFADKIQYTLDETKGDAKLLGISKPGKPLAKYDDVMGLLERFDAQDVTFKDGKASGNSGIVQSWHTPPRMESFDIGGDGFMPKFVMETPIDGFGKPLIYLSLLRQICTNGMIGYARAFRSELALGNGDDTMHSLERALDSYSNEEGYMALRQRMDSATNSWASIGETSKVLHAMTRTPFSQQGKGSSHINELGELSSLKGFHGVGDDGAYTADGLTMKLHKAFAATTGDLCHIYGIAHLDAISKRKMQALPARCTVYELMNFATELATHYCKPSDARQLHAICGTMLGGEFDLEGSRDECRTFADWHIATDGEAEEFRQTRDDIANN
jgi:hypothetical protein